MSGFIKQSTAHTFQLGPFIDDTDGKTAETGLTIAASAIYLSKHGGAAAAKNDSTALTGTGDSLGYYDCVLNATDTNTVGNLKIMAHITGALPVWQEFTVLPANVYDSIVGGSDYLDVSLVQWLGTAPLALSSQRVQTSVEAIGSGVITATSIATDAITAAKIAADAIGSSEFAQAAADKVWSTAARVLTANTNLNDPTAASIADAVWNEAATGHTDAGKAGQQLWTDIDAILADTDELQTDDVPTLIAALPTAEENRAEMDSNSTQLAAIVEDTGTTIPGTISTMQGNVTDILADTNELQTDWTNGGRLDLIADAILEDTNELQSDDYPTTLTAIKNKTDSLTFTVAGNVDSNVKYVNDVEVDGAGTEGDPWGPAA